MVFEVCFPKISCCVGRVTWPSLRVKEERERWTGTWYWCRPKTPDGKLPLSIMFYIISRFYWIIPLDTNLNGGWSSTASLIPTVTECRSWFNLKWFFLIWFNSGSVVSLSVFFIGLDVTGCEDNWISTSLSSNRNGVIGSIDGKYGWFFCGN